jgi:hypothetical protein
VVIRRRRIRLRRARLVLWGSMRGVQAGSSQDREVREIEANLDLALRRAIAVPRNTAGVGHA